MARQSGLTKRIAGDGADAVLTPPENTLLAKLPASEFAAFMEQAEHVSCTLRQPLFETGEPIERVYFPLTGMVSLVTVLNDGTSLEAMTVGCEGFVGLPLFHGVETHRTKGLCQIGGDFYQLSADGFVELVEDAPQLASVLHRYSQFANEVMAQSAACNSIHLLEQRCARWLLSTSDAVAKDTFNLTQEFLSQMLAVRRPGVTVAIGALERQSLISHRYGMVTILDREGLKKASCECYRTIRDKAHELLS
jgi:CRP-like cAMP-binding protein